VQNELQIPAIVIGPQCRPDSGWSPDSIMQLVEHAASRYSVDRDRVYLVGFSMGAYGTWQTAAAYPDVFAAIVTICDGGDPDQAELIVGIPVWAFHGDKDEVVPLTASEQMIDALRAAGGIPKLSILHGAGHGICNDVCQRDELWKWLLQQNRQNRGSHQTVTDVAGAPDS
jgi:predicted peptidase